MENELIPRIRDLDRASYSRGIRKWSCFLSESEQARLLSFHGLLQHPGCFYAGGWEDAERKLLIWPASYDGEERALLESELIALVKAEPVNARFSDELTHRDFLGALMNLGIERNRIGDILVKENAAFIFCMAELSGLLCEELTRVKHTEVRCFAVPLHECNHRPELREMKVNVASERLDAIISAVFRLSRKDAAEAVENERVFVDGKVAAGCGMRLGEGSRISVRGLGKFLYDGIENESRKGRLFVKIRLYV